MISGPLPTAEEIVTRMGARDVQRQVSHGGICRDAAVRTREPTSPQTRRNARSSARRPDGTKHFEVVSEEGWKAAHKHVLRKMLESESDTSRPTSVRKTKLNPENYDFEVIGTEPVADRTAYVLEIKPKRKEKYLFRGRIW